MLYLLADGLVKGALFIVVGIVDHHLHDVDERRLAGRGRHLPWAAGLMVAGALGLAGVPPFGTFLGKALMEEAATEAGAPWLVGLFVVVAALTSAALLRATGRVFLGLGGPGGLWTAPHPSGSGRLPSRSGAPPPGGGGWNAPAADHHRHAHPTQLAPAVGLLVAAVGVGLAPVTWLVVGMAAFGALLAVVVR